MGEQPRRRRVSSASFPVTLLIDDGLSSHGGPKGSDIGKFDTLMPLFVVRVYGLLVMVKHGIHQGRLPATKQSVGSLGLALSRILQFAVCVMLTMLIMDCRLRVWGVKSILSVICFSLVLFDRYLVFSCHSGLWAAFSPAIPIHTPSVGSGNS